MNNATYISLANQVALRRQLDVLANNVANANTTGFKGGKLLFTDYLANLGPGSQQQVAFPQDIGLARNFDEGPLTATGNPLDLAIKGDAFFTVNTANGPRYTRAGSFTLNAQGQITDQQGDPVLDERNNPIVVPADQGQITIGADGTISTENGQIARLGLSSFANPQLLKEESAGLYVPSGDAQPTPATDSTVVQGSLEGSNVQSILEMTHMIAMTHIYQDAQKLVDSEDNRQRQMIQTLTTQP